MSLLKAVAFGEALEQDFKVYQEQVIKTLKYFHKHYKKKALELFQED